MPAIRTVYLVHHTHTDLGYTHDPVTVWEMHRRFIDAAVDIAERDADRDAQRHPDAFKWTVETTAPLLHWLDSAASRDVERFCRLADHGRIEVTAMFAHLTPLASRAAYAESLRPLTRLRRDLGLTIRHAMTCDVNGHNWPLVDALLDHGIDAIALSSNDYVGGHPPGKPNVFWWQAATGRRLLTLNAWHYHTGNYAGIGPGPVTSLREHWPILQAQLDAAAWPWDFAMLQCTHQFGDNGSADYQLGDFVRRWNDGRTGDEPQLRFATPSEFWDAVRRASGPSVDTLPTLRGDWTDFWNFGAGSAAREVAVSRENESRLLTADGLLAWLGPLGVHGPAGDDPVPGRATRTVLGRAADFRQRGWHLLNVWNEHTFDADSSQQAPEGSDTYAQWYQKANTAYEARSLSTMIQRDGIAELSVFVPRDEDDALLLYNPLPWPRTVCGEIERVLYDPRPSGTDASAARHHQDRLVAKFIKGTKFLPATEVPALGYTLVRRDHLLTPLAAAPAAGGGWEGAGSEAATTVSPSFVVVKSDAPVIETDFVRLTFDRDRGGVQSWIDRRTGRELVDAAAAFPFGTPVHERVDTPGYPHGVFYQSRPWTEIPKQRGWQHAWPAKRGGAAGVLAHTVSRLPFGWLVTQQLRVDGLASPATVDTIVYDHTPSVEFAASWMMTSEPHPESTYFVLPFNVSGATARFDVGGQPVRVDDDQLPGTCRDYFTVQRWVDFSNDAFGVTVACPINPLVQLGDFNFAKDQPRGMPARATFLGWVTNNYWPTNFRPCQPGRVQARYLVTPRAGGFDESAAHRCGAEATMPIVMQSTFEPTRPGAALPRNGTLLKLPGTPLIVTQILPAWVADGAACGNTPDAVDVHLLNASDHATTATIEAGDVFRVMAATTRDAALSLAMGEGGVACTVAPRATANLRLMLARV